MRFPVKISRSTLLLFLQEQLTSANLLFCPLLVFALQCLANFLPKGLVETMDCIVVRFQLSIGRTHIVQSIPSRESLVDSKGLVIILDGLFVLIEIVETVASSIENLDGHSFVILE